MTEHIENYEDQDGKHWHLEQGEDGTLIVTDGELVAPLVGTLVVGELSNKTTPADFARFRRAALAWYARRRAIRHKRRPPGADLGQNPLPPGKKKS